MEQKRFLQDRDALKTILTNQENKLTVCKI